MTEYIDCFFVALAQKLEQILRQGYILLLRKQLDHRQNSETPTITEMPQSSDQHHHTYIHIPVKTKETVR